MNSSSFSDSNMNIKDSENLKKAIFERVYYFIQLQNLSMKEYLTLLTEALKERGFENDILY